uniref:Uncharacterized protein TCIL3000_11_3350 n=1 Tax=Trypanosoma congolense (strain IL3000) TaxID=1068625 RepID=G0UZW6_TRYCI|nr:unnamed protein product [Trypanosoma congolense IL3000]
MMPKGPAPKHDDSLTADSAEGLAALNVILKVRQAPKAHRPGQQQEQEASPPIGPVASCTEEFSDSTNSRPTCTNSSTSSSPGNPFAHATMREIRILESSCDVIPAAANGKSIMECNRVSGGIRKRASGQSNRQHLMAIPEQHPREVGPPNWDQYSQVPHGALHLTQQGPTIQVGVDCYSYTTNFSPIRGVSPVGALCTAQQKGGPPPYYDGSPYGYQDWNTGRCASVNHDHNGFSDRQQCGGSFFQHGIAPHCPAANPQGYGSSTYVCAGLPPAVGTAPYHVHGRAQVQWPGRCGPPYGEVALSPQSFQSPASRPPTSLCLPLSNAKLSTYVNDMSISRLGSPICTTASRTPPPQSLSVPEWGFRLHGGSGPAWALHRSPVPAPYSPLSQGGGSERWSAAMSVEPPKYSAHHYNNGERAMAGLSNMGRGAGSYEPVVGFARPAYPQRCDACCSCPKPPQAV